MNGHDVSALQIRATLPLNGWDSFHGPKMGCHVFGACL